MALAVPRGRPEELRLAADQLQRVAGSCLSVATVRGAAIHDVDVVWRGAAAAVAKSELTALSARTRSSLPQLREGGTALRAYADELEHAQQVMRRLRIRARAVADEHARERAAADLHVVDPGLREAAICRADDRRRERLAVVARERVRAMTELSIASGRCAVALHRLTPRGGDQAGLLLVDGLFLTRELLLQAVNPTPNQTEPEPEQPWWEDALDEVEDVGRWTWNEVAVPVVNTAADVAQAAVDHPEDIGGMALGVGMVIAGTGGEIGGVALDLTGVGAVAGVPLHVASAALIAGGVATAGAAAVQLGQHAAANDSMLLKEVRLRHGSRGMGGDPLPDSDRPAAAGSTWKGRIANNGDGVVWQRPEDMCPLPKICGANSMRIADPASRTFPDANGVKTQYHYPYGYTRFYNEGGQPLKLDGKPGTEAETHLPIRPDGTYDLPKGWNPP